MFVFHDIHLRYALSLCLFLLWSFKLSIFLSVAPQMLQSTVCTFPCWFLMCLLQLLLSEKPRWQTGQLNVPAKQYTVTVAIEAYITSVLLKLITTPIKTRPIHQSNDVWYELCLLLMWSFKPSTFLRVAPQILQSAVCTSPCWFLMCLLQCPICEKYRLHTGQANFPAIKDQRW